MQSLCQSDSWVSFLIKLSFSHTESQDHHTDRKSFCEKGSGRCSQHTGEQSIRLSGLLFVILTQTRVTNKRGTSAEDLPPPDWPKSGEGGVAAFPSPLIHVEGSSSLWVAPSPDTWFQVIYESKVIKLWKVPLWLLLLSCLSTYPAFPQWSTMIHKLNKPFSPKLLWFWCLSQQ